MRRPDVPCGVFAFTGTGHTNAGVTVTVDFDFDPATCGATCECDSVIHIQIIRIIDGDTGDFLAPGSDVTGDPNATQNGWAVDRIQVTPGSNTTNAQLRDTPRNWPEGAWFDAVSVPVCVDADATCNNSLVGYYYWLFIAAASGTATGDPFHEVGVTWMQDAFDKAVVEWNNDAPGLGKNSLPAMTRL